LLNWLWVVCDKVKVVYFYLGAIIQSFRQSKKPFLSKTQTAIIVAALLVVVLITIVIVITFRLFRKKRDGYHSLT